MKSEYSIKLVSKKECAHLLLTYHYLKDISKGFKSGYNFGLFKGEVLVGACIYTGFPVPEIVVGCFGLSRNDQQGMFELSRLVLDPDVQKSEHNLASWFVSKTINTLKKIVVVRAILSYADSGFHSGTVYKACNFKYYGLSESKKDFWILQPNGDYVKHSRGKTKDLLGEWRDRNKKHRYLLIFDKTLICKWIEQ